LKIPTNDIGSTHALLNPVASKNYNSSSIRCTDNDGDGYYFWGLVPKPSQCPPCPDQPDGDDSNPSVGLIDEFGNTICLSNLIITQPIIGSAQIYKSSDYITASNSISSGSTVNYGANNSVRLITGFKVYANNSFHADLTGCKVNTFKSAKIDNNGYHNANSKVAENVTNKKDMTLSAGNVFLYPNPTNDKLFVNGLAEFDVNIFDLSGRLLLNIAKVNGSIDISALNSGIYTVQLKSAGKTNIQKIVKK